MLQIFNVIGQRELIFGASWDCGSHPEAGKRGHIGEVEERPRSLHRKRKIRTSRRASALPGTTGRFRTTGLAATSCNVLEEPGHGVLSDIILMACRSLSLFPFRNNSCILSFLKSFAPLPFYDFFRHDSCQRICPIAVPVAYNRTGPSTIVTEQESTYQSRRGPESQGRLRSALRPALYR